MKDVDFPWGGYCRDGPAGGTVGKSEWCYGDRQRPTKPFAFTDLASPHRKAIAALVRRPDQVSGIAFFARSLLQMCNGRWVRLASEAPALAAAGMID